MIYPATFITKLSQSRCLINKISKRYFRYTSTSTEHRIAKGLVLGLYEKEDEKESRLTPSGEKFDARVKGQIRRLINEYNVSGKLGRTKVFHNIDGEFRSIAIAGLGREGAGYNELEMLDEGMENVRVAAGLGARELQLAGCVEVHVDSMEYAEQAAEGSYLAIYRFQDNKKRKDKIVVPKLEVWDSCEGDAWTRGLFKADAQNAARRLTDTPSNQMTPTMFARAAVDLLCPCGVTVETRAIDWIESHHLYSFLAVAKGSCEPPILMEINYCGTPPEEKPVLILGKGITYNSGGINLRRDHQHEFRGSMAGAAVTVAVIRAAAALSLPINLTAIIPLCENMPSGMSIKPGDVIKCMNGKLMAIDDTAKGGIAVMADPLVYAQATYKPRFIVDVATLGHGIAQAVGGGATGVFSNSHFLWQQLQKAGSITGDRMWRMPLWKYFRHRISESVSYNFSNHGRGEASSCLGAAVLHEFIPGIDWIHLDIRGVGMVSKTGNVPYLLARRMTGRPTRTIIQFLYQLACRDNVPPCPRCT